MEDFWSKCALSLIFFGCPHLSGRKIVGEDPDFLHHPEMIIPAKEPTNVKNTLVGQRTTDGNVLNGESLTKDIPSLKLTWHWKFTFSNRKYIFKWWIFHCYVSLLEGIFFDFHFYLSLGIQSYSQMMIGVYNL